MIVFMICAVPSPLEAEHVAQTLFHDAPVEAAVAGHQQAMVDQG